MLITDVFKYLLSSLFFKVLSVISGNVLKGSLKGRG